MGLSVLAAHVLLVVALGALWTAAFRLSSLLSPAGLERAVSSAVLLAAGAVLEALALGLVGLGGSTAALTAAALLTYLAARVWLPAPTIAAISELARWYRGLDLPSRAALGALGGGVLAVGVTILHRPTPGFDGITYHIPEVVGFVQSGHTGSVLSLYYGLPVGNYPITNEVLLAWLTGISHGFAALTLWSPVCYLLLFAAGWLGLRSLGVPHAPRALALVALMISPLVVAGLPIPDTDLATTTWLVCCAALCACARERPLLLVPAIIAFGLSVGTKTTAVLLGMVVLGLALWSQRRRVRAIATPLVIAVLAAVGVGGVWYLRNFIDHGSPLWPFLAAPWGDHVPLTVGLVSHSLADRFRVTLLDHLSSYISNLSGGALLIAGGALIPVLTRRRTPLIASAAVLIGTIAWANAPVTGLPDLPGLYGAVQSSVRYLLPVFAAGACALALAARERSIGARLTALTALCATLAWSLVSDLQHSFFIPFTSWLAPGVLIGAALAAAAPALARPRSLPRAGAAVTAALASAVGLALGSSGYLARHAKVVTEWDAAAAGFLARQPGFSSGRMAVAAAPDALGPLAGDRLRHRVSLISETATCTQIAALTRQAWVVIRVARAQPLPGHPGVLFPPLGSAQACLGPTPALYDDGSYRIYGPAAATDLRIAARGVRVRSS